MEKKSLDWFSSMTTLRTLCICYDLIGGYQELDRIISSYLGDDRYSSIDEVIFQPENAVIVHYMAYRVLRLIINDIDNLSPETYEKSIVVLKNQIKRISVLL